MNPVLLLLHCAHNMEYNRKSSTLENLCRSAVLGWPSYIDMSWVAVHAAGKRHGQWVGEIHEKVSNIAWNDTPGSFSTNRNTSIVPTYSGTSRRNKLRNTSACRCPLCPIWQISVHRPNESWNKKECTGFFSCFFAEIEINEPKASSTHCSK